MNIKKTLSNRIGFLDVQSVHQRHFDIIKNALINSLLTVLYISLIVSLMNFTKDFAVESTLVPIFVLTLFVFSVALMGILVFGKPVMLYLDSKKNDAVRMLLLTVLFIFVMLVIIGVVLLYSR